MAAEDQFANAIQLFGSDGGSNVGFTKQAGEPNHAGNAGGHSAWWYLYFGGETGTWRVSTAGSTFATLLAVYTGSAVNALTPVASSADGSPVEFEYVPSTEFWIAVDGKDGATGTIAISETKIDAPDPSGGPANDHIQNAAALLTGVEATGTNVGATSQFNEPNHGTFSETSVWWKWTADVTGEVSVDTAGSDFDTLLAVYTISGSDPRASLVAGTMTQVVSNLDPEEGLQAAATFAAASGTDYFIVVAGEFATGAIVLNLSAGPAGVTAALDVTEGFDGEEAPTPPPTIFAALDTTEPADGEPIVPPLIRRTVIAVVT